MSSHATQAVSAVVACTDPSNRPTKAQVMRIAELTHSGNPALDKVQQTLFARIAHPEWYSPREIEHTLTVIQQCSFIASLAFVEFFQGRLYAIAALANYTGSPPFGTATIARVQSKAKRLARFLQDEELVQRERSKSVAPLSPEFFSNAPSDDKGGAARIRGPWRGWSSYGEDIPSGSTYLPTPESSPERRSPPRDSRQHEYRSKVRFGLDDVVSGQEVRKIIDEGSSSYIASDRMDVMADMTFDSENFDILIRVLVERLLDHDESGGDYHLIKVLTIIKHCLLKGSPRFARWFFESRGMIAAHRGSPVPGVRKLAEEIFLRLDGGSEGTATPLQRGRSLDPPSYTTLPNSTSNVSFFTTTTDSSSFTLQEPVKDLTAFITTVGEHPIAGGGYSFVYKAVLSVGQSTEDVAKKILNSHQISHSRLAKRANREVRAWTRLSHPNIARLYGITHEKNGSIGLISPFFENGNIEQYLKKTLPNVDVLQIMMEIVLGVEYLHDQDIVHGDIKPSNIMIDYAGHAKLIDFGVSRITGESGNTTSGPGISWAYAAPELLLLADDGPVPKSKSSDIYALAITFIMSGRAAYRGMNSYAILETVKHGGGPDRPMPEEECNFCPEDGLWALLLCCWAPKPEDRPEIVTLREWLSMFEC